MGWREFNHHCSETSVQKPACKTGRAQRPTYSKNHQHSWSLFLVANAFAYRLFTNSPYNPRENRRALLTLRKEVQKRETQSDICRAFQCFLVCQTARGSLQPWCDTTEEANFALRFSPGKVWRVWFCLYAKTKSNANNTSLFPTTYRAPTGARKDIGDMMNGSQFAGDGNTP